MKKKPFYYWIPEWVLSSIDNKNCNICSMDFKKEGIIAIGLRKYNDNESIYIEHSCSTCNRKSLILVNKKKEASIENMCYSLLEYIKTKKISEKSAKLTNKLKGTLTEQEANKMIDFIRKSKTHDELLKKMGISPNKKPKNED